jgi:hypothetical protein
MAAVESLHAELADWERELKRRESDLDHRETELAKAAANRESGFAAELRELRLLVEQQAKT